MEFINKIVPIRELVLEDVLIFLIEAYFKLVLNNSEKIYHCKFDFCNIYIELYRICTKI